MLWLKTWKRSPGCFHDPGEKVDYPAGTRFRGRENCKDRQIEGTHSINKPPALNEFNNARGVIHL